MNRAFFASHKTTFESSCKKEEFTLKIHKYNLKFNKQNKMKESKPALEVLKIVPTQLNPL